MTTSPLLIARATLALFLLWSGAATGEEWRGARPGTTTVQELIRAFGEPSERTTAGQALTLQYLDKAAPQGTREATFRFSEGGLLERIEVLFEDRQVLSLGFEAPEGPAKAAASPAGVAAGAEFSPDELMRPATVEPSAPASGSAAIEPGRVPIFDGDLSENRDDKPLDILTIGGIYFQRAELSGSRDAATERTAFHPVLPSLVDVFLEVKPSETTRAFVRGRLLYDPLDPALASPSGVLDQLWFYFDIANRVYITAGRQQIKWGSSRLWNPTDFLRLPNPRPFDSFDLRTGVDMLKVNIPWESMASNLWLITTVDLNGPASDPVRYGGAARAEMAYGPGELALMAVFQEGRLPRYGMDVSMGAGPLDFYGELALVQDSDVSLWDRDSRGSFLQRDPDLSLVTSGGSTLTFRMADVFRTVIRLEGFYNSLGYGDQALLTWVHATGDYRPLFFGRYYGMAQINISRRSQYEPNLTFTTVMNLQDRSGLARLDLSAYLLRDTVTQFFLEMPFGRRGSEFRFQPDPQVLNLPAPRLPVFNAGVSVRIKM